MRNNCIQRRDKRYKEESRYIAIGRAAEQLNERLGTMEGEKDIYKIVNLGKR